MSAASLRPYQRQAIDAIFSAWAAGQRRLLLVMPTGGGKTVCFATIAERIRPQGRILVLAHREELIDQAREKIQAWTKLSVAIEMADQRADGIRGLFPSDVVVASVQTLARPQRLARFDPSQFALVIVDEAHHAPADTYQRILTHFESCRRLGVTATPERLDGKALGKLFDVAPVVIEIRDGIAGGWLCSIRQRRVVIDTMDLSRVRMTAGDLNEGDLERELIRSGTLHAMAKAIVDSAGPRRTLVFATTIAHARGLATAMAMHTNADGVDSVSGEDPKEMRREKIARFRAGDIQFLANCAVLSEGFDAPEIACVAMCRPTASRALYAQQIGRGTRIAPGKADLLVLDFAGNAGRHTLINVMDVLGGAEDPMVRARAERIVGAGEGCDVIDAITQAELELADQRRAEALAHAQREAAKAAAGARVEYHDVDPFAVLGQVPAKGRWGGLPMTQPQRDVLEQSGLSKDIKLATLDRGQASALIDQIIERRRKGLCTYKQARVLLRYGQNPDLPFDEARKALDEIAAREGWQSSAR